jgi:nucleoside-diphosphate-sugar epimerase
VGLPLALRLMEQGHDVTGWVHSQESAAKLSSHPFRRVIAGSVGDPLAWENVEDRFELVIHCASSSRGDSEVYQEVFMKGCDFMNRHQAQAHRLMVSSTSVYGETAGEIVTEITPPRPATMTGQILSLAEKEVLGSRGVVVRSAGIYGPGRGVLWEKFRRGEAVIEGDGLRWINQVHRDDLVSALLFLVEKGEPGQIYNASDNEPVTQLDFYRWCAEFLQKPLPPYGPVNTQRKRGLTNKRVSNAKLRGLEWKPTYPSFREGLASLV